VTSNDWLLATSSSVTSSNVDSFMSGVGIGEASLKEGGEFKSDEFSLD